MKGDLVSTIPRCIFISCMLFFMSGALRSLSGQGAEFLIITADELAQTVIEFAEWKYMKGIPTRVVRLTEIEPSGSPTKEEIKAYVSNAYYTWDPSPQYLLLVGDTLNIPCWYGPPSHPSPTKSDNPYGDITGGCEAEIAVGRFAVGTVDNCATVMAKTLAYERTPGLQGLEWLHKATLVMREDEENNQPYYESLNHLQTTLTGCGYDPVDYLVAYHYGGGADSTDVIEAIDDGRSFVVYRGSASVGAWTSPMYFLASSLNNGWKLPIVISGTCRTGDFTYPGAMCNTWTQGGSAQDPIAAVAFLAPTSVVAAEYWSWSRHFATIGIMDAILLENHTLLGDAFICGKNYMYYTWSGTTEDRIREYWAWSLAGDPTLQIWSGVPRNMAVECTSSVESEVPFDLTVTVHDLMLGEPIEGALITLYKAGGMAPEIFERDSTDGYGNAFFDDVVAPTTGVIKVTVTYHAWGIDYIPFRGEIGVFQMVTDDNSALAYNGNRHLARKPLSEELHLVYTRGGEVVYRRSANGGANWALPEIVGDGKFPAITLDAGELPSVTWTDDEGGLWYRRKTGTSTWSDIYHLDDPTGSNALHLNSPPSIAIIGDTVHILTTRSGLRPRQTYAHRLEDFSFHISSPGQGDFDLIDQKLGPPDPPLVLFPSLVRCEVNNSLHAAWQRVDTICYATKPRDCPWVNWGPQFSQQGRQSTHPFVETYGDSVYVVWQNEYAEDVYRAARHLQDDFYQWDNFSQTSTLSSVYPTNAFGFFTVYDEEPTTSYPYDAYYKTNPYGDRINISNTSGNSLYPQSVARFYGFDKFIYTAWLEGDDVPYEIKCKKIQHLDPEDFAYLSSSSGQVSASPYLVARDSFIDNWQIPVDVGNIAATYEFPLVPGYAYKAKAVVYHEGSGSWSGRIKIDNNLQFAVTYNANVPETLECWIPSALYEDSVLTVSFNRITGDFAAIGPIHIYRYEYDGGGGGPMSQQSQPMQNSSITVFPNPFTDRLSVTYQNASQGKVDLKVYDVTGRLVKRLTVPLDESLSYITWEGTDDHGRAVPQGVYFLRVDNPDSGNIIGQKILKLR